MDNQKDKNNSDTLTAQRAAKKCVGKEYYPPQFRIYGNFQSLTGGGGTNKNDSGGASADTRP